MDVRIFHGPITPDDLAHSLIAHFNRGNFRVQRIGSGARVAVQIASQQNAMSGGPTALSVLLSKVDDGVSVQIGKQAWVGVAASLGWTALVALRNPWALLSRIDDLAQDVESLQLTDEVWLAIEASARAAGASFELSERLRRLECRYCSTANPTGEPHCIACGAPLGNIQPTTCRKCGFVLRHNEKRCPNCQTSV